MTTKIGLDELYSAPHGEVHTSSTRGVAIFASQFLTGWRSILFGDVFVIAVVKMTKHLGGFTN